MQAHFRQRRKLEGAEFDDGNAESRWGWKQDVRDSSDRACEVLDFYVRKVGKEPFVTHIFITT